MKKVLTIIGTRPEAIKTIILHKLLMNNDLFEPYLLCTGQHVEMVNEVLEIFGVEADINIQIPDSVKSLSTKCSFILSSLDKHLAALSPDLIIVQGDTLSSFCGSLCAFFNKVPLIHIEAGLRTKNKWGPFPEEILRQLNDNLADVHFAPSSNAYKNLIEESISSDKIFITGNTGIDALKDIYEKLNLGILSPSESIDTTIDLIKSSGRKLALLTLHRRESHDDFVEKYLKPIDKVAAELGISVLYPLHPHPSLKLSLEEIHFEHIEMISPQNYIDFVAIMKSSDLFFTDSGGIQEEATYLGKPVLILRNETERPEAINLAYNELIDLKNLTRQVEKVLTKNDLDPISIYGDGNSSEKIIGHLTNLFGSE